MTILAITCSQLFAPVNGTIDNCGTKVGSRCTFGCVDGFYLDHGSSSRTCLETAKWDGTEAHCSGERVCGKTL